MKLHCYLLRGFTLIIINNQNYTSEQQSTFGKNCCTGASERERENSIYSKAKTCDTLIIASDFASSHSVCLLVCLFVLYMSTRQK